MKPETFRTCKSLLQNRHTTLTCTQRFWLQAAQNKQYEGVSGFNLKVWKMDNLCLGPAVVYWSCPREALEFKEIKIITTICPMALLLLWFWDRVRKSTWWLFPLSLAPPPNFAHAPSLLCKPLFITDSLSTAQDQDMCAASGFSYSNLSVRKCSTPVSRTVLQVERPHATTVSNCSHTTYKPPCVGSKQKCIYAVYIKYYVAKRLFLTWTGSCKKDATWRPWLKPTMFFPWSLLVFTLKAIGNSMM